MKNAVTHEFFQRGNKRLYSLNSELSQEDKRIVSVKAKIEELDKLLQHRYTAEFYQIVYSSLFSVL